MTRIFVVLSCLVAVALGDLPPSSSYGAPNYNTGNYNTGGGYQYPGPSPGPSPGGCNRFTGQGCIQIDPIPTRPSGCNPITGAGCGVRPTGPIGCNSINGQGCGGPGPIQTGGGTTVTKHIYVHVPPPEPEEPRQSVVQQQGITAQKHYKIIFIKTPSLSAQQQQIIRQQQQQSEEKTLIYVLSKRPEELEQQVIDQQIRPSVINKPEVYFIKYKTQSQQTGGNQNINTAVDSGINTGISTGTISTGTSISSTSTGGNLGYNANAQPY